MAFVSGSVLGGATMLAGGLLGSKGSKGSTQTSTATLDPRMAQLYYGDGGANTGIANLLYQQAAKGQSPGQTWLGQGLDSYLGGWGTDNFMKSQQAAQGLQGSNLAAPGVAAAQVGQAQVNAPSQNSMDLSGSFKDFINGTPGANPFLTGGIQKGINQSANAFQAMQEDSGQALQDTLGSIDGGAIAAGQFGGSRQGLAQGRAISDFTKQQQRAVSQFGQNNTDAAVAAQAGAYDADRNRALQATMGLSGQQYGVASQNANLAQHAYDANAQQWADAQRLNQSSTLQTNALNSNNQLAGTGLSSQLLGQAYNMSNGINNADLARLSQVSGALSPFSGLGQTTTQTAPGQGGGGAGILGGITSGLGLFNQFMKL